MSVDAIIVGDIHLRDDQPECWVDDYWEAQAEAIKEISDLQKEYKCAVYAPGDIFNKWNSSLYLTGWAIENLPKGMMVIPGQHDLPQHILEKIDRTALNILYRSNKVMGLEFGFPYASKYNGAHVYGFPWNADLGPLEINPKKHKSEAFIALCHVMTYIGKNLPYPGCEADNATKLLKKMKGFDLICVGDNHEPFVVEHEGRLLVNPGSMMRMTAGQIDHKPRVYLWDAKKNEVEIHYLPRKYDAINRDHIDVKDQRDDRIDAFVSRLSDDGIEIGLSFESNLKEFMAKQKTKKSVKDLVWELVE